MYLIVKASTRACRKRRHYNAEESVIEDLGSYSLGKDLTERIDNTGSYLISLDNACLTKYADLPIALENHIIPEYSIKPHDYFLLINMKS